MLCELSIQNIAIIDQAHISFGPGLNVLTGETGAGKSIILGAISLVLGVRATSQWIRKGALTASVEARFSAGVPSLPQKEQKDLWQKGLHQRLEKVGIEADPDGDLIIRRTLSLSKDNQNQVRSRIFINGQMATRSVLRDLAAGLVDLTAQREHQILLNPKNHRAILDHFAACSALLKEMAQLRHSMQNLYDRFRKITENQLERRKRKDYLAYQIKEIEQIDPKDGEENALEQELQKLAHVEDLMQGAQSCLALLESEGSSILSGINHVLQQLNKAKKIAPQDSNLTQAQNLLNEALIQSQEGKYEIENFIGSLEADPERLQSVENRLQALHQLRRKHDMSLAEIHKYFQEMKQELADLQEDDENLDFFIQEGQSVLEKATKTSQKIHQVRQKTALQLGQKIQKELKELGMKDSDVKIQLTALPQSTHSFPVSPQEAGFNAYGCEEVQFLLAPNKGEGFRPLHQIASGGELSRILLALKCILSPGEEVGTYLFDEIDSGIGGMTGKKVGKKLKTLSHLGQVICISHLPQIACFADHHLRVSKGEKKGRTRTLISPLTQEERIEELSRLLGGSKATQTSRVHAKELLQECT